MGLQQTQVLRCTYIGILMHLFLHQTWDIINIIRWSAASCDTRSSNASKDLLPIDMTAALLWWLTEARGQASEFASSGGLCSVLHYLGLALAALLSLNFLACAGWTSAPVCLELLPALDPGPNQVSGAYLGLMSACVEAP